MYTNYDKITEIKTKAFMKFLSLLGKHKICECMDIVPMDSDYEQIKIQKLISKKDFKKLANDFLVETENDDKSKMPWETKNHIPMLHNSINEFYIWLEKNYWNDEK